MTPYDEAHLFVAAIRVLQHRKNSAPLIEDICDLLDLSVESGLSITRKLEKHNIVEIFSDPFSTKVNVKDHLAIENLPKDHKQENSLASELEKFMAKKKNMDKKVETIQAELEAKKKSMFDEIEKKLKGKKQN